jgi:hypothetical protein
LIHELDTEFQDLLEDLGEFNEQVQQKKDAEPKKKKEVDSYDSIQASLRMDKKAVPHKEVLTEKEQAVLRKKRLEQLQQEAETELEPKSKKRDTKELTKREMGLKNFEKKAEEQQAALKKQNRPDEIANKATNLKKKVF